MLFWFRWTVLKPNWIRVPIYWFGVTYHSLVLEGVVDTAEDEPEGPEVLKAKLEDEVSHQYQCPHQQELHIQKCAAKTEMQLFLMKS